MATVRSGHLGFMRQVHAVVSCFEARSVDVVKRWSGVISAANKNRSTTKTPLICNRPSNQAIRSVSCFRYACECFGPWFGMSLAGSVKAFA